MLVTNERPTVVQIAVRAWNSLFHYAPRFMPLILVTAILVAALNRLPAFLALPSLDDLDRMVRSGRGLPSGSILPVFGLDFSQTIVRPFLLAPAAVAMHRFILLNDRRSFSFLSLVTVRFAFWIFMIKGLAMLGVWMAFFVRQPVLGSLLVMPLVIGLVFLIFRGALLYPGVAVNEQSVGAFNRIDTAVKRSRGMFWLIVGALVLTLLPVLLLESAVWYKFGMGASLYLALWDSVCTVIYAVLAAALASHLYSYAAHQTVVTKYRS